MVAQLAMQIKNRSTQDGVSRFYVSLLESRRYSAAASVGNLLSFLSRCTVFIDLPPRIIRELTDRCYDYMLGASEEERRVLPLGWLMSVPRNQQILSDCLKDRLAATIERGTSDEKMLALHLISALNIPMHLVERPFSTGWQELNSYWYQVSLDLGERYRGLFLEAARESDLFMTVCYYRKWVTFLRSLSNQDHSILCFGRICGPE